jgi:drug/metabolite transporter (DMT)-like permease
MATATKEELDRMGVNTAVVVLSVSAALAFSVSTTLKNRSASQVPPALPTRSRAGALARFTGATLRHPLWLAGLLADGVGLACQIIALHLGPLALVQPLMVTGLLFALLLRHTRPWHVSRTELLWGVLLVACLIAFLTLSGSVSGTQHPSTADRLPAVIAAAAGVLTSVVCLGLARRRLPPAGRAALIGVAVGSVYAATAALMKAATDVAASHGWTAVLLGWQLYTVILLGGIGLFLTQLAFQAGPLTASLPAISTIDPLLSIAIGVLVYDEHIHRGPLYGAVLLILMLVLATSVIQLGRIEAVELPDRHAESPS